MPLYRTKLFCFMKPCSVAWPKSRLNNSVMKTLRISWPLSTIQNNLIIIHVTLWTQQLKYKQTNRLGFSVYKVRKWELDFLCKVKCSTQLYAVRRMRKFCSCKNMPTDLLQQYQLQLIINETLHLCNAYVSDCRSKRWTVSNRFGKICLSI